VGGRVLSAMTIEHFILRLPYNVKHVRLYCCHVRGWKKNLKLDVYYGEYENPNTPLVDR
jgi:hypothetical protein